MATVSTIRPFAIARPIIAIPVVTLERIYRMKKNRDGIFIRCQVAALIWDPTVVRALLDEKIYRNPTVALIGPTRARKM